MKYKANPVVVTAFKIKEIEHIVNSSGLNLTLDNDQQVVATAAMVARMMPVVDDYWVLQEDGYCYLNPKEVFERKYTRITE